MNTNNSTPQQYSEADERQKKVEAVTYQLEKMTQLAIGQTISNEDLLYFLKVWSSNYIDEIVNYFDEKIYFFDQAIAHVMSRASEDKSLCSAITTCLQLDKEVNKRQSTILAAKLINLIQNDNSNSYKTDVQDILQDLDLSDRYQCQSVTAVANINQRNCQYLANKILQLPLINQAIKHISPQMLLDLCLNSLNYGSGLYVSEKADSFNNIIETLKTIESPDSAAYSIMLFFSKGLHALRQRKVLQLNTASEILNRKAFLEIDAEYGVIVSMLLSSLTEELKNEPKQQDMCSLLMSYCNTLRNILECELSKDKQPSTTLQVATINALKKLVQETANISFLPNINNLNYFYLLHYLLRQHDVLHSPHIRPDLLNLVSRMCSLFSAYDSTKPDWIDRLILSVLRSEDLQSLFKDLSDEDALSKMASISPEEIAEICSAES